MEILFRVAELSTYTLLLLSFQKIKNQYEFNENF